MFCIHHRQLRMWLVVVLALMLLIPNTSWADTTGQQAGTTATGWTNPLNLFASDNLYNTATMNTSVQSPGPVRVKGFNFNIPEGSTINGIEVTMERKHVKSGGAGFYDEMACLIINNADVYASNRAVLYTYWSTVESIKTFGGPTDLWGQTLTPADINSPNFGFYFGGRKITYTVTAYIDYIGMTVYYTPPAVPDTEAPVIAAQSDMIIEATDALGAIATFNPTATDNVDSVVNVVCTPESGSQFPLGSTLVTCNATDTAGNPALPVTFNVIVQDTTAPVITLNGGDPISINQDTVYTELGATWTDAVDGTGNAIVGGDTVNTSLPGTSYVVTYDYTDTHNNAAVQVTRTVNVLDTSPPVIDAFADMTEEATSAAGAIVTFSPTAADNMDPAVTVVCSPPSGSQFALGTTLVTCNATDTAGNAALPVTFNVTVQDTTAPIITLNGTDPYNVEAGGTYNDPGAVWNDAVDGTGPAVIGGNTVDMFIPGPYVVTYDYTDNAGNVGIQVKRTVNVSDTSAPVIAPQSDMTVEAADASGAVVSFNPAATDSVDTVVTVVCTPPSGSQFPLGSTLVTCNATDTAGNPALPVTFNVIVQDTTAPVITLNGGDPISINQDTVYTELGATWTDAVDGTGNAIVGGDTVNTSLPGTSYVVTYDYTDTHNNAAVQVTRTVNVLDTSPPVIDAFADMTEEATSAAGAIVTFSPTAADNLDPAVTVVCNPASGSQFALGTTLVTCNATDSAGNAALPMTFNVTVQDTTAPIITLNGTDPYDVPYGSSYTDPGAVWTDAVDGTGAALIGGDVVDTLVPGAYVITYNYTDSAGNAAIQVPRTVNVLPWSTINVTKDVLNWKGKATADPYVFTVQMNGADNKSISETITATYDHLAPGTYIITELSEAKYELKQIIGDNNGNASDGVSITVGSGDVVNVTFINWVIQPNKK